MKNLLTFILIIANFEIYAQNEVFRIDSIPKQGVLLDKGWKWHAGDNPDFAKPDFDDTHWESIDPTKKIDQLPQIKRAGIGWFRIHIKIDSSLQNTILSLQSNQIVASEFYQNGVFIGNFGKIINIPEDVEAYAPLGYYKPVIHLYTGSKTEQVLAIRFAVQPVSNVMYHEVPNTQVYCLAVKLKRSEPKSAMRRDAVNGRNYEQSGDFEGNSLDYFKAGLFFILSLLHICMFTFYRIQKANLFFGFGCFLMFIFYLLEALVYQYFHNLSIVVFYAKAFWPLGLIAYILLLNAVYCLFLNEKGIVFYILTFFVIVNIICELLNKPLPYLVGAVIFLMIYLEVGRVSLLAYKNSKEGAWILLIGTFCFVISFLFYIVYISNPFENRIPEHIAANISFLSIPISITLFLSREFAQTSKSLTLKLVEVQQLSHEKQEALQKQNAELQAALLKGQTIERQRVALDLHDNLGSTLSALWLSIDTIDKSKMDAEEKEIHQNLRENLEKAYNDVRLLSHNLLPEEFEKQGLTAILQGFVRKMNKNSTIKFDLKIDEDFGRVDNKIEFELYSICLELVNNIIKHSKATEAKIALSRTEKQIELIVSDNGIGTFNNESDGKGMKNVKARVESLNGTWDLQNIENQGVRSEVVIPV